MPGIGFEQKVLLISPPLLVLKSPIPAACKNATLTAAYIGTKRFCTFYHTLPIYAPSSQEPTNDGYVMLFVFWSAGKGICPEGPKSNLKILTLQSSTLKKLIHPPQLYYLCPPQNSRSHATQHLHHLNRNATSFPSVCRPNTLMGSPMRTGMYLTIFNQTMTTWLGKVPFW